MLPIQQICFASIFLASPSSGRNSDSCLFRIYFSGRSVEVWCTDKLFQSSLISATQSLPNKLGPEPFTTINDRATCCVSYSTLTTSVPNTTSCCPEYVRSRVVVGFSFGGFFHSLLYVASLIRDTAAPVSTSIFNGAPLTDSSTVYGDFCLPSK